MERWQYRPVKEGDVHNNETGNENILTRNNWVRVLRIGKGVLPCKAICEKTDGKFGLNTVMKDENNIAWRLVEEYYF